MAAPNEISVLQLLRLIGTPECPVIVDVSIDADVRTDPFLIPSAFRHSHEDITGLQARVEGHRTVIVCQGGKKLSQGVAALLRARGVAAEYLCGGNLAWAAQKGCPRVPLAALVDRMGVPSLWVTRHRPKIDRIACPWLIRRFVDRDAEFLFVQPSEVAEVAARFGATAFDIEGCYWSHRGEMCTFDTMIAEFGLQTPALDLLAQVVRAADTNRHDLAPEAAGLLALSVGLSRLYKDDLAQLAAGMSVYDALYRWARDGQNEGHDWPGGTA